MILPIFVAPPVPLTFHDINLRAQFIKDMPHYKYGGLYCWDMGGRECTEKGKEVTERVRSEKKRQHSAQTAKYTCTLSPNPMIPINLGDL